MKTEFSVWANCPFNNGTVIPCMNNGTVQCKDRSRGCISVDRHRWAQMSSSSPRVFSHTHCGANNSGVAKASKMEVQIHVLFTFHLSEMVSSKEVVSAIMGGPLVCPPSCIHFHICVHRCLLPLRRFYWSRVPVSHRKIFFLFLRFVCNVLLHVISGLWVSM